MIKVQQCLFKEVNQLKNELALAYNNVKDDMSLKQEIEQNQIAWIASKQEICGTLTYDKKEYNLVQNVQVLECERKMMSERILLLNKLN